MDASNKLEVDKLEFILGGYSVPRGQLNAFDWLGITQAVLEICQPYLKYFPDFKPISEFLNSYDGYDSRTTDASTVKFPGKIDFKTRVVRIRGGLSCDNEGNLEGSGVKHAKGKELLLTQEGQWLVWNFQYEWVSHRGNCYQSTSIEEKSSQCQFSLINEQELFALFKQYPDLGWAIFSLLHSLIAKAIKERKERLKIFECINEELDSIRNRID